MAVPVCPDCGATIQPDWDWCHTCGFDPEGLRPPEPNAEAGVAAVVEGPALAERPRRATSPAGDTPPSSLRPHDLLRPATGDAPAEPLTGPLVAPEPDAEHRPLTLDDLRRTTGPAEAPAAAAPSEAPPGPTGPAPAPAPSGPKAPTGAAAAAPPARDRFSSVADRTRPPRPSDLGGAPSRRVDDRPPLFPAPPTTAEPTSAPEADPAPVAALVDPVDPVAPVDEAPAPPPGGTFDELHPYLDLPYDDPSPAPGTEPEPEPTSRLRRRKPQDNRPNAATMAMAAGRIPSDGSDTATVPSDLPPPPPGAPPPPASAASASGPSPASKAAPAPPSAIERPSAPADTSSLGPIVFGATPGPVMPATKPKAKSSPLSWAAILMTLAIAVIVLWPTYKNLSESESGPALPPPSAGAIGYAPAGADGVRAPVDPKRTASWETSAPSGAGFEVDMPGVVVVRTPAIPLGSDSGTGVVASSSSGRGGYVVAAIDPAAGKSFATTQQAADAVIAGFNGVAGNDLKAGAATTLGSVPAIAVEGTVDGVPSKGAIALVGNRAYLAVAGNVSTADLERFLTSFAVTDATSTSTAPTTITSP